MRNITRQQWFRIESFRRALTVGLGAQLLAVPALVAQDNVVTTPPPEEVKKVVITGSLIPTAESVGVAPVDTIRAETIEKSGASDVADLLKRLTPSFSGNGNVGQEVNNGGFGESNVQIRNLTTLVLLNGHRLGNSSFSDGQFVDVNTVPLAAIDRVEVLKDGASALYGSEAIGGVVNIITKRNYNGVEVGGRYGFATREGSFQEERATLVMGTGNEKSSITVAAQYYHRDALASSDRKIASMGRDDLNNSDIDAPSVSYMSPSFPGKVQEGGNGAQYLLRGSPLMKLYRPADYDPSIKTPPRIPDGAGGYKVFSGPTAVSDYNNDPYWANNDLPTPYSRINGSFVLNTTTFGTDSIQNQDKRNVFVTGDHELFDKQMVLFGDFLYANIDSEGKLAPSPVTGLGPKQSNIDIPGNNVYNPFGIDLGPTAGPGGLPPGGPRIRSRFVDSGNRLFDAQTDYYHFVGGLKGDWDNGWGYNAAYNYNRYDQTQFTRNAINGAALDQALKPNNNPAYAGLSQLLGSDGLPVPMYNIFSVGGNDPRTVQAISTTLYQSGRSEEWDAIGSVHGSPFRLPGGDFSFVAGGGFTSESLVNDFDGLTRIGKVPGLNAALPTSGRRDSWAGFIEARIPIFSPDNDCFLLHSLEVTAAGRYETFDPGGDRAVPKLGLRWQPFDEQLTLRGNYSESFVAPTTFQLFGGDAVNVPALQLPTDGTGETVTVLQEYEVNRSTSTLKASDAKSWGAGVVFSPRCIKNLTVSADYYHIKQDNAVFRLPDQPMVDSLNELGSNSPYRQYFFRADGTQLTTSAPNQANDADWGTLIDPYANGSQVETDGVDLSATYRLPTETVGMFNFYVAANVLLSYDYSDPFAGKFRYGGLFSDPNTGDPGGQGTLPNYQINAGLSWDILNFTLSANGRYIPEVTTASGQFFTVSGNNWVVDSWYTLDLQLAYAFKSESGRKWFDGIRLAVGCNNITDNLPPLIASAFEDNTDKSAYDIVGRFVYFEASKKF